LPRRGDHQFFFLLSFRQALPIIIIETLEPTTFVAFPGAAGKGSIRESPDRKAGAADDDHFVLQKEEWELECMRLDTRERFHPVCREQPRPAAAGTAEIPGFLSEYETGDVQPAETPFKKTAPVFR
jgi:hypothetical protein